MIIGTIPEDKFIMKFSRFTTIEEKVHLTDKIFVLRLSCPEIASIAKPGQFVQLRLANYGAYLWPRPFSIHQAKDGIISLTIKRCGAITNRLSRLDKGDNVYTTGPLGNRFNIPSQWKPIYLVAGGVGLPPLHFLCETLLKNGCPAEYIHFFSGAGCADDLFADEEIKSLGVNYILTTDDGSAGVKGFITKPLEEKIAEFINTDISQRPIIYSCGPMPMLKKIAEICSGFECYVSLEQLMPCGWGVCNGCAVKVVNRNNSAVEDERGFRLARVCKEGPIFEASEILWE